MDSTIRIGSINTRGLMRKLKLAHDICSSLDILCIQETWALPTNLDRIHNLHPHFNGWGNSAVNLEAGPLVGRPYGGIAILTRKNLLVKHIPCDTSRIGAVEIILNEATSLFLFNIYMPTDDKDNLPEFVECLAYMLSIIEELQAQNCIIVGDFNANPGSLFGRELRKFCDEYELKWLDVDSLPADSYTFMSDAHHTTSWLDHCLVTEPLTKLNLEINIDYSIDWTDHRLLTMKLEVEGLVKVNYGKNKNEKPSIWRPRDSDDIQKYQQTAHTLFIDVLPILDQNLTPEEVKNEIDELYLKIVDNMKKAAESVFRKRKGRSWNAIPGWNNHVKDKYESSRRAFLRWMDAGRPVDGSIYEERKSTKLEFKQALRTCQNSEEQMKMDALARDLKNKNFVSFWAKTNTATKSRNTTPTHVDGKTNDTDIANTFCDNFMGLSPLIENKSPKNMKSAEDEEIVISVEEVRSALKSMAAGKSPGHDTLTLEHVKNAGWIVPILLANLFTSMIKWNYLPMEFTKTIVTPILKNRQLDASDSSNYRPISLATVCARIFEKVILRKYAANLTVSDSQVGFKTGGSTDMGIFSLKHTVSHYIRRDTSVYAAYLDLSKAFDRVVHSKLWQKLRERKLPNPVVDILAKWHGEQENVIRWNDATSEPAPLRCGVRQGGSSSPVLFNVYMDELSQQLRGSGVGCHVAGTCVNHISYADDMVLLAPTISALRLLLRICEKYAQSHGLLYNAKKTKAMLFKARTSMKLTLPVTIDGQQIEWVDEFKYLGHIISSNLSDSKDIDRQRRALSVRSNMLARRFSRCSDEVKLMLFQTYCTNMYTCELWSNHTKEDLRILRVQYNNAFRIVLRLPKFCSASTMFKDARLPGFAALMRQRAANTRERFYNSDNAIMSALLQCHGPTLYRWNEIHIKRTYDVFK